jgi:hypothetical protein
MINIPALGLTKPMAPLLLGLFLFLATSEQLPAPIQEVPESPTPAGTVAPTAKPKAKPSPKPKTEPSESAERPVQQQSSSTRSRFAGTWVGTIPAFPTGPQDTVLTIDPRETTMLHTWTGHPPTQVAKTEIKGDTIQATFPNGVATYSFAVTPMPDGVTASVHMQAVMNDFTAVFRRAGAEPSR